MAHFNEKSVFLPFLSVYRQFIFVIKLLLHLEVVTTCTFPQTLITQARPMAERILRVYLYLIAVVRNLTNLHFHESNYTETVPADGRAQFFSANIAALDLEKNLLVARFQGSAYRVNQSTGYIFVRPRHKTNHGGRSKRDGTWWTRVR